jgi:hypothetical protein
MTHPYTVHTAKPGIPVQTQHIQATDPTAARLTAIELAGPGAVVVRCAREGQW